MRLLKTKVLFSKFREKKCKIFSYLNLTVMLLLLLTFNLSASGFEGVKSNPVDNQQPVKISGTVTDASTGEALPGVNVIIPGTSIGVITNASGNFTIEVPDASVTLQFSFIGYVTQEMKVGTQTQINIALNAEITALDEIVVIGYGTQKKVNLTGAIATVSEKELTRLPPVASITGALAGVMPGLTVIQSTGKPGSDGASLKIRDFGTALIIVDGVESSSFNILDANEIESISILKDASAAIYGSRAGNGVILVTTRRGKIAKPTITLNSSYTLQSNTIFLHPVSSGDYYTWKREGWINGGSIGTPPVTEEEIAKLYDGSDPDYNNTNWFDILFKKRSPQQQHNLSVSGGTDNIKYYGYLGSLNQGSFFTSNDGNFKRYNFRSNIDAKITEDLSAQMDFSTIITNDSFSERASGSYIWQDVWDNLDPRYGPIPDKTKMPFTGGGGLTNPVALASSETGTRLQNIHNLKSTVGFNYNAPFLKGLSAKATGTYVKIYSQTSSRSKPYSTWEYIYASQTYVEHPGLSGNTLSESRNTDQTLTGQVSLNFNRSFGTDHNVTALLLYEVIDYATNSISAGRQKFLSSDLEYLFGGSSDTQTNNGSATQMGRASIVSRLNYSYKNKYLLEATLRRDASAKFAEEGRWGTFPGISLGWKISEENFMKNNVSFIDNLKLRGGYSEMGNDAIGNFLYLSGFKYGRNVVIGTSALTSLVTTGLPNPYLTWESMNISNLGLDISLFKRKIFGEFDIFNRFRDGITGNALSVIPSTLGANPPLVNINSTRTKGFEALIGSSNTISDLRFDIGANLSYSRTKWVHYEESEYTDPDQIRQSKLSGEFVDRVFGYRSAGLFSSPEEIANLGFDQDGRGNSTLNLGDIKYIDINTDGKLDWRDQVELGNSSPHWFLGINTQLTFKGFNLAAVFQGAFDYLSSMTMTPRGIPSAEGFKNRWLPSVNDPDGLVPRNGSKAATNGYTSDFNLKNFNYLRLETASIGYNLPDNWLKKIGLTSARLYVAGTNLFTLSKVMRTYGVDPEAPSGQAGYYYPQQRTVTYGINLSF